LEKSIHFQTLDLTKCIFFFLDPNMCTISGTKHTKTIFSSCPGIVKHSMGKSDDFFTQLVYIFSLFTISNVFYKTSEENIHRS